MNLAFLKMADFNNPNTTFLVWKNNIACVFFLVFFSGHGSMAAYSLLFEWALVKVLDPVAYPFTKIPQSTYFVSERGT